MRNVSALSHLQEIRCSSACLKRWLAASLASGIAGWIVPPVSHAAIARYNNLRVKPVLANAEELKKLLRPNPNDGNEGISDDRQRSSTATT